MNHFSEVRTQGQLTEQCMHTHVCACTFFVRIACKCLADEVKKKKKCIRFELLVLTFMDGKVAVANGIIGLL
jgi:hypothetical protein